MPAASPKASPSKLIHGDELIATVRTLQTARVRPTRLVETPLALVGSMFASLLAIAALSISTRSLPPATTPAVAQSSLQPKPEHVHPATPRSVPLQQAVIQAIDPQNDAQLREWKKRNAESMRILKKTTKEMPLR